jgi:transmembrane sensor
MSLLDEAREREVPWDEVREQRVLARIAQARRAPKTPRPRRWIVGGAVVFAAAALAWLALQGPSAPAPHTGSRLALADGSEVMLEEAARLEIILESEDEVRIAQHDGLAHYAVSHQPSRTFVVACGAIEVVVRGTRFSVERREHEVEVVVEEGRVEVRHDGEPAMLGAGASLTLPLRVEPAPVTSAPEPSEAASVEPAALPEPIEPPASAPARAEPSRPIDPDALLSEADEARRGGDAARAARALRAAIDALGPSPRAATASFTLGRVERSRSRHRAAAEAFEAAYAEDPGSILAEDALAEATVSWADAGETARASTSAARYLERYPSGEYVDRVRRAIER